MVGEAKYDDVVKHTIEIFFKKFLYFVTKIGKMDSLFENHFSTIENTHGKVSALAMSIRCM